MYIDIFVQVGQSTDVQCSSQMNNLAQIWASLDHKTIFCRGANDGPTYPLYDRSDVNSWSYTCICTHICTYTCIGAFHRFRTSGESSRLTPTTPMLSFLINRNFKDYESAQAHARFLPSTNPAFADASLWGGQRKILWPCWFVAHFALRQLGMSYWRGRRLKDYWPTHFRRWEAPGVIVPRFEVTHISLDSPQSSKANESNYGRLTWPGTSNRTNLVTSRSHCRNSFPAKVVHNVLHISQGNPIKLVEVRLTHSPTTVASVEEGNLTRAWASHSRKASATRNIKEQSLVSETKGTDKQHRMHQIDYSITQLQIPDLDSPR